MYVTKHVLNATGVVYLGLEVQSLVGITFSLLDCAVDNASLTGKVTHYHFT